MHKTDKARWRAEEATIRLTGYGQSPGELDFEGYLIG